ncbi:hypothetical protein Csa_022945 [Cucumis sativus]|nr:hypothetical protein Csa_022945 [Cucumis sativus]
MVLDAFVGGAMNRKEKRESLGRGSSQDGSDYGQLRGNGFPQWVTTRFNSNVNLWGIDYQDKMIVRMKNSINSIADLTPYTSSSESNFRSKITSPKSCATIKSPELPLSVDSEKVFAIEESMIRFSLNVFFLFSVFFVVEAQMDSQDAENSAFQPSLGFVIGILGVMFLLTFILLVYAKFCHRRASISVDDVNHPRQIRSSPRFSGIDKTVPKKGWNVQSVFRNLKISKFFGYCQSASMLFILTASIIGSKNMLAVLFAGEELAPRT